MSGTSAEVYLHGAHVVSFIPAGGELTSADVSIEGFPSGWTLLMTVVVSDDSGGMLKQTMACVNNGSEDVRTTQALHSYYRVSAVGSVSVRGLQGTPYLDNLASRATTPGATEAVTFAEEVDRIYINAGSEIVLCDGGGGRDIVIAKEGFDDIVVWNPWVDKAKKFVDFGDEEYNSMLCIEPANAAKYVAGETVAVKAGETWTASQSVYVRQL